VHRVAGGRRRKKPPLNVGRDSQLGVDDDVIALDPRERRADAATRS